MHTTSPTHFIAETEPKLNDSVGTSPTHFSAETEQKTEPKTEPRTEPKTEPWDMCKITDPDSFSIVNVAQALALTMTTYSLSTV